MISHPFAAPATRIAVAAGAIAGLAWAASGAAQPIRGERPRTFVIGAPAGARTFRVDGARTGLTRTSLPTSPLRVEWRTQTGAAMDHAPLVDARGDTYVVGARGEVVALSRSGVELWRCPTGGTDPGPPALLSDDSVVWVGSSGEAVAVREGGVRWRSRIGKALVDGSPHPAPLPLDDGGIVVATSRELAVLDAEGRERARTTLPEPAAAPLLSALRRVVVVGRSGTVWTWRPGDPDPRRAGAFGSPIAGSAALADDHTLVAVVAGGTTLAAFDLLQGTLASLAVATAGIWLGSPALRGGMATLALLGATSETAVTLDASGREIARALLSTHAALPRPDGGAPVRVEASSDGTRPPSALLVDVAGTVAFATLAGSVGIVASGADAAVEILSDICASVTSGGAGLAMPAAAGIAPLGPGSFVVACRGGAVAALGGASDH